MSLIEKIRDFVTQPPMFEEPPLDLESLFQSYRPDPTEQDLDTARAIITAQIRLGLVPFDQRTPEGLTRKLTSLAERLRYIGTRPVEERGSYIESTLTRMRVEGFETSEVITLETGHVQRVLTEALCLPNPQSRIP